MGRIAEAIAILEDAESDIPSIGKTELEYRLCDLERDAENLANVPVSELEDAALALASAIHDLYGEV